MTIGFIGTGEITKAVVTGMSTVDGEKPTILVSPRNEEIAATLADRFENFLGYLAGPTLRATALLGQDGNAFAARRNVGRHQRLTDVHVAALRAGDVPVFDLLVISAAISEPSLKFMAVGAAKLIDDHSIATLFLGFSRHT